MNYMDRLARVSSQVMMLTGFFHGIIRMDPLGARPLEAKAESKTNIVRYHILKCLECCGPHHPTDVSTSLNVKKNTLSELLDRMVRDGLVLRGHAPDDRRKVVLRITPRGRTAIKDFERSLMGNIKGFLERLDGADRRDMVRAIESLVRILARHDKKSAKMSA